MRDGVCTVSGACGRTFGNEYAMRDFPRVNIPAVISAPDKSACVCVERRNAHILRCRPLGRLVLPVVRDSSSSDFFARGRRQDNTLDKGEYHLLLPEALGRSAAYIRLKATVSEMSSRANSCIVKIKLSTKNHHHQNQEASKNEGSTKTKKTYKYTKKTCSVSLPEDRNSSACDDDDDEPSTPR